MAGGSGLTRGAVSLTHRSIETLRPAESPYRVSDRRCIGLAVRVAPSGLKTWDLAYRIRGSGTARRVSLGRVGDVSLERARERANELTSAARGGRDLIAEEEESRAAAASRLTVEKLIELYVRRRVTGRLRTAKEIERRLGRTLSPILHRYANDIRRRDIRELLDAAADEGIEREAPADRWRDVPLGPVAGHCRDGRHCRIEGLRPRHATRSRPVSRGNRDALEMARFKRPSIGPGGHYETRASDRRPTGKAMAEAPEADQIEHALDPFLRFGPRPPSHRQRERDVVGDRQMREQRVVLEHHAEIPGMRRLIEDRASVEQDVPGRRLLEAREHHQGRGLARSGRTQERQEFSGLDRKVELLDGVGLSVVGLADSFQGYHAGQRAASFVTTHCGSPFKGRDSLLRTAERVRRRIGSARSDRRMHRAFLPDGGYGAPSDGSTLASNAP